MLDPNNPSAPEIKFPATTEIFWNDIQKLASAARSLIGNKEIENKSLQQAPIIIKNNINANQQSNLKESELITERVLTYLAELLALQTLSTTRRNDVEEQSLKMELWLNETKKSLQFDRKKCLQEEAPNDYKERRDEILMESLTAGWLALYFLGVPFPQPWERVRRIADNRGGFPSGACINKFVGDIFRFARWQMTRDLSMANDPDSSELQGLHLKAQVLVLSFSPLAIIQRLIDVNDDNRTPSSAHLLGRCYIILQMRLYLDAGFPIKYFVTIDALKLGCQKIKNQNPKRPLKLEEVRDWVGRIFPGKINSQQVYALIEPDDIAGMPTCVLGPEVGIYVLDTSTFYVPYAGNHVERLLLKSYRKKLEALEPAGVKGGVIDLQQDASYERLGTFLGF